jgi:hypothetical protein
MTFINKFILNILLFNIFELSKSYNLCVVGGSSSLGREIIYQSIDYSDIITEDIINNYKNTIDQIVLISANGVGDSLKNSNIGIKIMNNWYLKDVYRAKNKQEEIIKNYNKKNKNCTINIIRPNVLTYGENIYNVLSREKLAQKILDTLN